MRRPRVSKTKDKDTPNGHWESGATKWTKLELKLLVSAILRLATVVCHTSKCNACHHLVAISRQSILKENFNSFHGEKLCAKTIQVNKVTF